MLVEILPAIGICAVCSWLLTWVARWSSVRLGFVDKPDSARKFHERPTPLLGGAAVFVALCLVVGVGYKFDFLTSWDHIDSPHFKSMFLVSGGLFCVLGLIDDRWPLKPRQKFLGQILASLPFAIWAVSIKSILIMGIHLPLGVFGLLFTVLWIVTCSNIVNLLDGLDGLAGGIGVIATFTTAMICVIMGSLEAAAMALLLSSAIAGFLIHNWPPAKIFLGDSGSLMIGGLLGCLSLQTSVKTATSCTLLIPVLVMSIPMFDTIMAIVRRKLSGKSIGHADRGHIHHRLQQRGLSRRETLLWILSMSGLMGLSAIMAALFKSELLGLYVAFTLAGFMIAGEVFGHHEARLLWGHVTAILQLFGDTWNVLKARIGAAQIILAEDTSHDDLWNLLILRMQQSGGTTLLLTSKPSPNAASNHLRSWDTSILSFDKKSVFRQPSRQWTIEYSTLSADGCQLQLSGSGELSHSNHHHLDDLYRLFILYSQVRQAAQEGLEEQGRARQAA